MKNVRLGKKIIGDGNPCYFIAEIGGLFKNFEEAKRLIDSAIEIGVDAVKFQTLEADTITTKKNFFDMEATGHISQFDVFKEFEISKKLQKKVVEYADQKGITVFSAPSHMKDLEIMEEMELPIYKIGSDLACHIPLLKEVAKKGKPIILSTGMCTLQEVEESVKSIISTGNDQLVLMHCVSDYPTKVDETNLSAIQTMKDKFDLPVGMSDHNTGITTTFAAAVIGANLVERHLRDPRNSTSSDDIHALTKEEFTNLIKEIRLVESAKGDGIKSPTVSEKKNLTTNRVSIVSLQKIPKDAIISKDMIDIRRPGNGIPPKYFESIIGKKAKKNIQSEEPLSFDMIEM